MAAAVAQAGDLLLGSKRDLLELHLKRFEIFAGHSAEALEALAHTRLAYAVARAQWVTAKHLG